MLVVALLSLSLLGCRQGSSAADSLSLPASAGETSLPPSSDPDVRAATSALARGEPWRASRLLEPALRDSSRRSPAVVLLAAEAAAAWNGWERVHGLLSGQPWLDTLAGGRARALLAAAALERRADAEAATEAARAVAAARSKRERAARLVVLARAHDRLDQRDSAAAAYEEAAEALPEIGDWLRLRAAGVRGDSAARAGLYASLRTEVARERVGVTEAQARERFGDFAGAAREFARANERADALRVRLLGAATDSAQRATIRGELLALATARPGTSQGIAAVDLLDRNFAPLTPAEELTVGRASAAGGRHARAVTGLERALTARLGTSEDRFSYATSLAAIGRDREAATQFARVTSPRSLAALAAYRRARSLMRAGDGPGARRALAAVPNSHPRDTVAAATALFLLGDLTVDDGNDAAARARFREVGRRYPTSSYAPLARFRAAVIAYAHGDIATAAREFDSLAARYPRSVERNAADYWAGRARARLGDSATARTRWRAIVEREPISYYAMLAARRLGETPWAPPANDSTIPHAARVDSAMARASLLERLGMDVEARFEYAQLEEEADATPARLLATASAFEREDLAPRAIRLAWRAIELGAARDARVYRLAYPVAHESVLVASAKARGLEPELVAALIRQESSFNPRATSPVGARGLMQLMPSVGAALACAQGITDWDPVLLYQPDLNMQLGTVHLAGLLKGEPRLERSLASYNAGASRTARWRTRAGADDPELFVERIPYDETRDYVRIVLRNRELYRALYGW
jgi:soluble lytic murein transglycosylase